MTIAIDFNKPVTTDLYTAWPTLLQANMQSLGTLLDTAYVTIANQPAGTKRWNSTSGLLEQWSGSAWAAVSTGYALKAGDNFTGAMTFANAVALQWKDTGGTARRSALLSGSNFYFGDIDNAVTGSSTLVRANNTIEFDVNAAAILNITGSAVASNRVIVATPGSGEAFRAVNDNGFISFYNTAASTRTGYLQGSSGSALTLMAENGNYLQLGTNGGARMTVSPGGNVGINQSPSAWGSSFRGLEMSAVGNGLMASASTLYVVNNVYFNGTNWILGAAAGACIYLQSGGSHSWYVMPTGAAGSNTTPVSVVNIDVNGNFMVGTGTPTSNAAGRGLIEVNGSANALIALDVGGSRKAYMHYTGSQLNVVSESGSGPLALYGNGINGYTLNTNGTSTFSAGAATTRFAIGSQATLTVDWSKSNYQTMTLTASVAAAGWVFSNAQDGQTITLKITQDATGGRTLAANTAVKWPLGVLGVLSTAANAVDLLCLTYDAATGFYYATLAKGMA
jgi:hypothetical protein